MQRFLRNSGLLAVLAAWALAAAAEYPDRAIRFIVPQAAGSGTPGEFAALIRKDSAKWADVVRRSGAKID